MGDEEGACAIIRFSEHLACRYSSRCARYDCLSTTTRARTANEIWRTITHGRLWVCKQIIRAAHQCSGSPHECAHSLRDHCLVCVVFFSESPLRTAPSKQSHSEPRITSKLVKSHIHPRAQVILINNEMDVQFRCSHACTVS